MRPVIDESTGYVKQTIKNQKSINNKKRIAKTQYPFFVFQKKSLNNKDKKASDKISTKQSSNKGRERKAVFIERR